MVYKHLKDIKYGSQNGEELFRMVPASISRNEQMILTKGKNRGKTSGPIRLHNLSK